LPAKADPLEVKVGVLHETHSRETVSILDIPAVDDFVAGVRMATEDNNTTGRFLDQSFSVVDAKLAPGDDPIAPLNEMLADGVRFLIVDLPPDKVLAVADAARAKDARSTVRQTRNGAVSNAVRVRQGSHPICAALTAEIRARLAVRKASCDSLTRLPTGAPAMRQALPWSVPRPG